MGQLSLCMIVRDEERNLPGCLDSAAGAMDEIVIVDTGSADRTAEIAGRYTDRIFTFNWIDDFAAARNFSYSKATKDFIMWLDADDIITPENYDKLLRLKPFLTGDVDYVLAQYRTHYNDDGSASMIFPKVRISRRAMDLRWYGAVHENLEIRGKGLSVDLYVDHKHKDPRESHERDMRILKKEIDSGRTDYHIYLFYGLARYYEGHWDEAERYFNMLIDAGQTKAFDPVEMFVALHCIYKARGDFARAKAVLVDNEGLMSDKSEYYCCLGLFYLECEDDPGTACRLYEKALTCRGTFLKADILGQRDPDYYYHIPYGLLGKAYVRLREPETALTYFERALAYKKTDEVERLIYKLKNLIELKQTVDYV